MEGSAPTLATADGRSVGPANAKPAGAVGAGFGGIAPAGPSSLSALPSKKNLFKAASLGQINQIGLDMREGATVTLPPITSQPLVGRKKSTGFDNIVSTAMVVNNAIPTKREGDNSSTWPRALPTWIRLPRAGSSTSERRAAREQKKRDSALEKFRVADTGKDGMLDLEELVASAEVFGLTLAEAEDWFAELDVGGSGFLSEEFFVGKLLEAEDARRARYSAGSLRFLSRTPSLSASEVAAKWKHVANSRQLDKAMKKFSELDADGNGTLSLEEVVGGAALLYMRPAEAEAWFHELDVDGTGVINPDEFLAKYKASGVFTSMLYGATSALESAAHFTSSLTSGMLDTFKEPVDMLDKTFSTVDELGRGVLAKAFTSTTIGALPLRLLRGHVVYSRNWKSDLWLHLKNKQIFLSLFFVHEDHPFSKAERISAITVSCLLAWGLEFWFCVFWTSCDEHPDKNFVELFIHVLLLKIGVSAVTNGIYDAILEQAMTCACVQEGCPAVVKSGCEMCSFMALLVQAAGGGVLIFLGGLALIGGLESFGVAGRAEGLHDGAFYGFLMVTIRELIIGKCVGLFVVTMLVECLGFFARRKAQMKPPKSDTKARAAWETKSVSIFGVEGPAPSYMWNRFIGKDIEVENLPDWAPTYDVQVFFFWKLAYEEKFMEPSKIPKWFVDPDFLPGGAKASLLGDRRRNNRPSADLALSFEHPWANRGPGGSGKKPKDALTLALDAVVKRHSHRGAAEPSPSLPSSPPSSKSPLASPLSPQSPLSRSSRVHPAAGSTRGDVGMPVNKKEGRDLEAV